MYKNRAAIYCRLSKDDEQVGDSVSIETQKMLLIGYCKSQNFEIADTYVDDGYSGLNFNRPSFKKLISDLENGQFDIVVTKDLSRLGRDYIQTGYYIDVYFSMKHIRYIAVNDGIDTLTDNNDIAPFKNILNDMYAKDLSRKVKSAKYQRAKSGLYISAQPPYGYRVDPNNKNKLVVDPPAAKIVKYIFELMSKEKNYSKISRILESRQIISPSVYKAMNGDTRFIKFTLRDQIYKWPYQTVRSIVTNRVYVGDIVNHKFETVNYKTKERVRVPVEDQIVVPNTHEPIIDRKTFEFINSPFAKRRSSNHRYENIFKELVYCAECGEEMQLIARRTSAGIRPMFRCPKHAADNTACTKNHFIYYEDLLREISAQLSLQMEKLIASNIYADLCEEVVKDIGERAQKVAIENLQTSLQSVNKKIKNSYKSCAEKNSVGLERLYHTQKSLLRKITDSGANFDSAAKRKIGAIEAILKDYLLQIPVNKNTLNTLIKKIRIGDLEKDASDNRFQVIEIHYLF